MVLALVAVGCSGGSKPSAAPDTTPVTETTTTLPSTTVTTGKPTTTSSTVPRTTVTTVLSLGPGDAFLSGTVTGPNGPVDGATVHVERLVGKAVASTDVTTVAGSWQLPSILGGSYRVRAFKSPDLAQSDVQVFFLAANERKQVDFKLAAAGGDRITAAINPNPPRVDQPASLLITVGVGRVDDQGRPAITPRPGVAVTLSPGSGYVLMSSPVAVTDGNGNAAWSLRCAVEGANSVGLALPYGLTTVNLPACVAGAAPATTRPA